MDVEVDGSGVAGGVMKDATREEKMPDAVRRLSRADCWRAGAAAAAVEGMSGVEEDAGDDLAAVACC